MSLPRGTRLGPYEVLGLIGAGGMGEVYKAHDVRLDRGVAVKVLPAATAADPERLNLFEREARVVASLSHANVLAVYDVGTCEGTPYLVTELLEGQTLRARLASGSLTPAKALEFAIQIAQGMSAAHAKGIVHRDLKPDNLFVTSDGTIKILDFGVARLTEAGAAGSSTATTTSLSTATGAVRGTLGYMAPEQARGQAVDHRADIFAFGCVLYEMLAGVRPFAGDTPSDTLAALLTRDPPALELSGRPAAPALQEVVRRCLEKEPSERFSSAHDLALALRAVSSGETAVRRPDVLAWLRRHGLAVTSTASLVVVATAIVVWIMGSGPVLSFAPRDWILVADVDNQTGEHVFDRSLDTAFAVSLEQSTHANVYPRSRLASTLQRMGRPGDARVDDSTGREICVRENIRGLISPAITRVGQTYSLTARIIDPTHGQTVTSYQKTANSPNEVLRALGSLAADIRRDLGESLASIAQSNRDLPQVTTSSLDALSMYADARGLWSRGKYAEAVQLYESAIKADPDFAMAHAALGIAYYSHIYNKPVEGKVHLERAKQLSHRTTQREAQVIAITSASQLGRFDDARTLFEIYLKAFPDDAPIRYNYAGALRDHGEYDSAVAQYREVLRVAPNDAGALINLATSYLALDRTDDALKAYEEAFALQPDWITSGNLNHEYGFAWVKAGDLSRAEAVFNRGLAAGNKPLSIRSLALLDMYRGRYGRALERLHEAILLSQSSKSALSEARNELFLATALQARGESQNSLAAVERAAHRIQETKGQVWMTARIGVAFARGGSPGRARRMLDKARAEAEPADAQHASEVHRLEGEIELAQGAHAKAVPLLLLADREHHWPLTQESVARAYRLTGDTARAVAAHETLVAMRAGSLGWEAQQGWLEGQYWLATLYANEAAGDRALPVLDEILARWKEADSDLPMLRRALQLRQQLTSMPRRH